MRTLAFTCSERVPLSRREICRRIADVGRWAEFEGYGPIPGIERAAYERRTDGMVGSRIRVENEDGSTHVEEIVEWVLDERVLIQMTDFSAPLNRFAEFFVEEWRFSSDGGTTLVSRTFRLHPRGRIGRLVLWLVAVFLRRAVCRHLERMRADTDRDAAARRSSPRPR